MTHLLASISLSLPTDLISRSITRLVLAALLGGVIGLERQLKRRPAGLRTNMFICFGAAMFTILSTELASEFGIGDRTRIAAQIIPGIGFIGAGSILHAKNGVTGLTTAATLFVVASIGMACGGGLYLLAFFATVLIVIALLGLGWAETRFNLKPLSMIYSILTNKSADEILGAASGVLHNMGKEIQGVHVTRTETQARIAFTMEGTRKEHRTLMERLHQSEDLKTFEAVPGEEAVE
jgi:putative Mg2+ transporter-C (MgtC) family protein